MIIEQADLHSDNRTGWTYIVIIEQANSHSDSRTGGLT